MTNYDAATGHNIPEIFWLYPEPDRPGAQRRRPRPTALLFDPWSIAMGLPISDAYWARVKVAGQKQDVLIQAFERRVLTYQPERAPQLAGADGQHRPALLPVALRRDLV